MFFTFNIVPKFFALLLSASFVASAINTGFWPLKCDLTAMVTGVSVIALASLLSVFPVHGETTIISVMFLGPIGSASVISFMIFFNQMLSTSSIIALALPNLVSVSYKFFDIIGITS